MTEEKAKTSTKPSLWQLDAFLNAHQKEGSRIFFALAFIFSLRFIWFLFRVLGGKSVSWIVSGWALGIALAFLAAGIILRASEREGEEDRRDTIRVLVLTLGGALGFFTFLMGVLLILFDWNQYFVPPPAGAGEAPALLELWKKNLWRILICELAFVGGLVLMFISFKMAKTAERTNATLRRLFYGYNAVLTGLLLVAILGVLNLLAYVPLSPFSWFNKPVDWTPQQVYTLNPASENLLEGLKQPVEVYHVLHPGMAASEFERLLQTCKTVNPDQFDYQVVDPFRSPEAVSRVMERFNLSTSDLQDFSGFRGCAVVAYGPKDNQQKEIIPFSEVATSTPASEQGDRPSSFRFTGEKALVSAIRKLSQGGTSKIYFLEGHGELSIDERAMLKLDQGAAILKEQLEDKGHFKVESLKLLGKGGKDRVPDDASVVVIAGPRDGLPLETVNLLRDYLRRQERKKDNKVTVTAGRLLILLDVVEGQKGGMMDTKLEGLLREHQVRASNLRTLMASNNFRIPPEQLVVVGDSKSDNAIAREFSTGGSRRIFTFFNARSVDAIPSMGRGPAPFQVEKVLVTSSQYYNWEEDNLVADGREIGLSYLRQDRLEELKKKFIDKVPMAVAVSSTSRSVPVPGHAPVPGKSRPVMIVCGDSTWISNGVLARQRDNTHTDLFASCLSWLGGRSDIGIDVPPSDRKFFSLKDKQIGSVSQLYFLPGVIMLLTILGLGGGIWISRRR